jgi:hypothetical protein
LQIPAQWIWSQGRLALRMTRHAQSDGSARAGAFWPGRFEGRWMKNRAQALSLLTELRGRLDELEQMICLSPDFVVLTPALHDEPGVEVLTPPGYLTFRQTAPAAPQTHKAYEAFASFVQFGAPGPDATATYESFALSDLHRGATEAATGLRLVPHSASLGVSEADRSKWFTYELISDPITLSDWDWVEWMVKLSCDAPLRLKPQFLVDQGGQTTRIALPDCWQGSFATFQQFRLDRRPPCACA